jgi:hypothetical protein
MNVRNLESRLIKLEGRSGHAGKLLLIWRRPKETVAAAVDKVRHLFGPDDRVMLAFWYGGDDLPAPAWHDESFPRALDQRERDYLYRWADERDADLKKRRDPAAEKPTTERLHQFTDAELWYQLLQVERAARREVGH